MAYTTRLSGYVKFLRGTPAAWAEISPKDPDTLYFIANPSDTKGRLYLGNKLISGGGSGEGSAVTIGDLQDVLIGANVPANAVLVYNETSQVWEPVSLATAIQNVVEVMTGATSEQDGLAGLVPQPVAGDNTLFLRGDGVWADPTTAVNQRIDNLLGSDTGSIRDIASGLITELVGNAPEDLNTLEELAAWARAHEDALDLTEMTANVSLLNDALFGTDPDATETNEDLAAMVQTEGVIRILTSLKDSIFGDGTTTFGFEGDIRDLNSRLETVETNISDIQEKLQWQDIEIVEDSGQ